MTDEEFIRIKTFLKNKYGIDMKGKKKIVEEAELILQTFRIFQQTVNIAAPVFADRGQLFSGEAAHGPDPAGNEGAADMLQSIHAEAVNAREIQIPFPPAINMYL